MDRRAVRAGVGSWGEGPGVGWEEGVRCVSCWVGSGSGRGGSCWVGHFDDGYGDWGLGWWKERWGCVLFCWKSLVLWGEGVV